MLNAIRYIDLFTVSEMLSLYSPNCEQWLTQDRGAKCVHRLEVIHKSLNN